MSLRNAHEFIARAARDPALAAAIEGLGPDVALDDIATLAATRGIECTADEIRRAHRQSRALTALARGQARAG
ncbi:MAG: Nif11-like leader peptide family RiPP precursor [Sphingomonas sp.]